ncbi:hypothetical protein GCM10010409_06020 [Mycolicibacterium diernhoferi]
MRPRIFVSVVGATMSLIVPGCATPSEVAATTTVTTTVTANGTPSTRSVRQIIEEDGPTDWLKRLDSVGLGEWPLVTLNDWAWDICEQLWVGGDYEKIIAAKAVGSVSREDVVAVYRAAVGKTCNQPPGAPPGMP